MIFKPQLVRKILEGKKTQTRRPVKPGELECRYRPGRSYALQSGRGRPAIAQITIREVVEQGLGEISYADALAEGFRTVELFIDYWRGLYGTVDLEQRVWVISFALDRDPPPRLLHAKSQYGYTSDPHEALPDEPEAMEPDARWANGSAGLHAATRAHTDDRRLAPLTPEQRYRELLEMARTRGIDIRSDVRVIQARLDAIERKVRRAA